MPAAQPTPNFDRGTYIRQSTAAPVTTGQSSQAHTAVAEALLQPTPPPGDGRRGGLDHWQNMQKESETVVRMLAEDGLPEWRPDASLLPPQKPPDATMGELLAAVPAGGTALLAFGNAGGASMLKNWAYHILKLGLGRAMVIAAFDDVLFRELRALQLPAYNYSGALPSIHFRGTPFLFHRMGFLKATAIRQVLETGRHVLVSDADVVWVRDPTAELDELAAAGATLAASTDCLHAAADEDKTPRRHSPYLCGHSPGNVFGAVFNTGILYFRAAPAAIAFTRLWANTTLALPENLWWSDDQGVFNRLLTSSDFYPVKDMGLGGRLVRAPHGLVVAPLPARRFCSGHRVWVQQGAKVSDCVAVHATYTEFGDAGKRWRFLEAGLWGPLPPRYFEEGRYLTFEPPKPPADPAPCAAGEGEYHPGAPTVPLPCGGEDPTHTLRRPKPAGDRLAAEALERSARLRANIELMRRQLHALRDALALAVVLNRTLVLPQFDCVCDRSELVDFVPSCTFPGAPPLAVPFKCSTAFVLNIHKLLYLLDPPAYGLSPQWIGGRVAAPISLRAHAFLGDARTATAIREGAIDVTVDGTPPPPDPTNKRCSAPHDRTCTPPDGRFGGGGGASRAGGGGAGGRALALRRGASNVEVLRVLDAPAVRGVRLLRLSDAEGAFRGWETDPTQALVFNTIERFFLLGGDWCCSSRVANEGRLYPVDPPPLVAPR